MPKIQRIIVPDIPKPVSHYCHVTRAGPHVWVAGVVGQPPDGSIPCDGVSQFDIATRDRPNINPRLIAYLGENLPASTLVEVKGLVDPRMKVEIECQAYVDSSAHEWGGRLGFDAAMSSRVQRGAPRGSQHRARLIDVKSP